MEIDHEDNPDFMRGHPHAPPDLDILRGARATRTSTNTTPIVEVNQAARPNLVNGGTA
jgi:hypothetical protein